MSVLILHVLYVVAITAEAMTAAAGACLDRLTLAARPDGIRF